MGGQGGSQVRSTLLEVMLETVKLRGAESGTREAPEPEKRSTNDPQTTPRRREERNMFNSISLYHTHTTAELYRALATATTAPYRKSGRLYNTLCTPYMASEPIQ